jgi:hypothetical protein
LRRLFYPGAQRILFGLSACTNLTELTIDAAALYDADDTFHSLCQLQRLKITSLPVDEWPALRQLRHLTHLESDRLAHFTDYTGAGMIDNNESGDSDRPLLESLLPSCRAVVLDGRRLRGEFTGLAKLWYRGGEDSDDKRVYFGAMLNNRRHDDAGREIQFATKTVDVCAWRDGVPDGDGAVYPWHSSWYADFAKLAEITAWTPLYRTQWHNGRQISPPPRQHPRRRSINSVGVVVVLLLIRKRRRRHRR